MDADTPLVALLQAVNLGRHGLVPMARLREVAADHGYREVSTLLATGNLLARPPVDWTGSRAELVTRLTEVLDRELGLPLGLVIRTRDQLSAVLTANPYPEAAESEPSRLVVMFYGGRVPEGSPDLSRYGTERATWRNEEAYVHYPAGIGRSRLTGAVLDRVAGQRGSGRNWNTVRKIADRLDAMAAG